MEGLLPYFGAESCVPVFGPLVLVPEVIYLDSVQMIEAPVSLRT